jgi:ABC-2 type transport system permease protein
MYKTLVKLYLKESFSLKRLLGFDLKKSKVKAILIGLVIIYSLVVFIGAIGYMFFDLGDILKQMGQTHILLSFLTIYSLSLSVIIVLFRASGSIFYYKDYDITAPLPIHPRTILWAKMTVLLLILYASSFVFTLPITFSYFYWNGFSVVGFLFYLIGFIFLPLVPVLVMSLISLLIAMITARFRKSGQINLFSGISKAYPPFAWFMDAVHNQSILSLIYLVASNGILFFLFIYFIQGFVQRTNQRGIRANIKKNGKAITYQERSIVTALVQKEFKKFFSITLYAVNAGLGPVLLTVLSIASLFYTQQIEAFLGEMVGTGLDAEILIMGLVGFSVAMTYTPAISLSLEGKNFWIIKSLPVKAETVMLSKIIFNLLLILPIAIISILLFGFSLRIGVLNQLLLIFLVITFGILISFIDSSINLWVPKFDFMNEVEVIKQSAGVMLSVFGAFGLMALNGLFYYLVSPHLELSFIMLWMALLNGVLALPFIYIVKTKSTPLFNKMKA